MPRRHVCAPLAGKDPSYYGFSATRRGDTMAGEMLDANGRTKIGTWSATLGAKQLASDCDPHGSKDPMVWPKPKKCAARGREDGP